MIRIMTGIGPNLLLYSKVFRKGADPSMTYYATKGKHSCNMFFPTIFHKIVDLELNNIPIYIKIHTF